MIMFSFKRNMGSAMFVFCGLVLSATHIHAVDLGNGWGPNALEVAKLPDYCQKFFREKVLPPNCDGVHHLCAGKVLINRASDFSIPKAERQRILRMAKGEVGYIFTRKNPYCATMPEARAAESQIRTLEMMLR